MQNQLNARKNMNIFRYLYITLTFLSIPVYAQEVYQTNVQNRLIKSLQVKVAGEMISTPCIELNGGDFIEINFDALNANPTRYAYSIIHCDADWKKSILSPIEYLNGFQGMVIEDFANSMGTTTLYTNYHLQLPNEDIQFKVSGNYAIRVYDEDIPDKTVFTACFSIVESMIDISASVTGNTTIDTYRSHQQVDFTINHKNFPINYPLTDLKLWVYQNNRRDNSVTDLQPMSILDNQLVYANNTNLIFNAGNEYRRMEFLSNRYNGMHVENISFHNPYYHVDLMTDHIRSNQTYLYDQDQNGRFFIRCSDCNDSDTESDYNIVHFSLISEHLFDGNLYLLSDIYHNVLDEKSRMGYNIESGRYEKSELLKQGNYNYMYLFVPNGEKKGLTAQTEGDYFETENEYSIYIYYRPMGEQYDRLIGITTVRNTIKML